MIATPSFSLAEVMVARMRRDKAARDHTASDTAPHPHSDPNPDHQDPGLRTQDPSPPTLSPLSTDWDLLLDYLSPSLSVGALCTRHALSPGELAEFLARPDVQHTIAVIQSIAAARLPLLDLHLPQAIRATHLAIVSQAPPEDPRLAARHAETARKSAGALQRLLPPVENRERPAIPQSTPLDASMPPASMPFPSIILPPSRPLPPSAETAPARLCEAGGAGAPSPDDAASTASAGPDRVPLVRGAAQPPNQCERAVEPDRTNPCGALAPPELAAAA